MGLSKRVICGSALRGLAVGLMLAAVTAHPGASQRAALPPFTVTALDGTVVEGATLASDGTWLFVHVHAKCGACAALLAHLDKAQRPGVARIVIVGGGMDEAAVAALAAGYPNLAASRWVADAPRAVAEALGLKAAPAVLGMRAREIHWRLAGGVPDARELESILFTWLETP